MTEQPKKRPSRFPPDWDWLPIIEVESGPPPWLVWCLDWLDLLARGAVFGAGWALGWLGIRWWLGL